MKFAYVIFFALLLTFQAGAANGPNGRLGLDLGTGLLSDYGFLGLGARYFVSGWQDLHASVGADPNGGMIGVGSRLYYHLAASKCFFIIPCDQRLFMGVTALRSGGGLVSVTDGGAAGSYNQSSGLAGSVTLGEYNVFWNHVSLGFEIGYRWWIHRPALAYVSGVQSTQLENDVAAWSKNSMTVALTLGWLF